MSDVVRRERIRRVEFKEDSEWVTACRDSVVERVMSPMLLFAKKQQVGEVKRGENV